MIQPICLFGPNLALPSPLAVFFIFFYSPPDMCILAVTDFT